MGAALQPSALPAALLNTQVKKIKATRCLVCQRTGLCTLFRSFTREKDSQLMNSTSGVKKNKERKTLVLKKLKKRNAKECVSEEGDITPHCLMVLIQKKKKSQSQLKKRRGLELFAFSVSVFQREKVSSDPSHTHYRYMGRSGIKGRGFNNITFLRFAVLFEFTRQTQVSVWVYQSKQENLIWPIRKETMVNTNTGSVRHGGMLMFYVS